MHIPEASVPCDQRIAVSVFCSADIDHIIIRKDIVNMAHKFRGCHCFDIDILRTICYSIDFGGVCRFIVAQPFSYFISGKLRPALIRFDLQNIDLCFCGHLPFILIVDNIFQSTGLRDFFCERLQSFSASI